MVVWDVHRGWDSWLRVSWRSTDERLGVRKGPELGASCVFLRSVMLSVFSGKLFDVLESGMNKVSWFTC